MSIIIQMEEQFQSQNIMPSQAYFGNQEILFHTAQFVRGRQQHSISKVNFNAHQSKKWLIQKISQQTYQLSRQLKQNQFSQQQCVLYYLKRILKHIIDDADKAGINMEHKILYLTFKYIAHLICKRSPSNNIPNQHLVSIHQWLVQAHSLLFGQPPTNNKNEVSSGQQLIQLLRRKDYQGMILILNEMGSAAQFDPLHKRRVQFTIKITNIKIENSNIQFVKTPFAEDIKASNKLSLQNCKQEYQQIFARDRIRRVDEDRDRLQAVCQVLFIKYDYIKTLVKDSWPLFLTHTLEVHYEVTNYKALRQQVTNFLAYKKNARVELTKQNQYFLDLISCRNIHILYQSLLGLVAPYYANLIAYYFFFFYQATPLLSIFQPDYISDLIRSLLQHASQASYICLFLTFSFLKNNQFTNKNGQILQALLYYHLSVIDIDDEEQVQLFIKKINLLSTLSIQKYGFTHSKLFFDRVMQNKRLNEFVVKNLLFVATVYQKYYNFQEEIKAFITNYFQNQELSHQDLYAIKQIRSKLQGKKKYKKQLTLFNRLDPYFYHFQILQLAAINNDYIAQRQLVLQLLKLVSQSRPLLSLILRIVSSQKLKRVEIGRVQEENRPQYYYFMRHVQVFLDHYPLIRSIDQQAVLNQIQTKLQ